MLAPQFVQFFLVLTALTEMPMDLLAILQKSMDRVIFLYNFIREVRLSGVRARSQLCTFENSTKCTEISFDLRSYSEYLKGLLNDVSRD